MGKSGSRVNIGNVDINIQPKIKQVEGNEESLPQQYRECLLRNPLLGRIEGAQKAVGWKELSIRTFQLLVAVKSNASLQQRITELEQELEYLRLRNV
jgi:hypothetical protein